MTANPPLPRQPLQRWLTFDWPAPTAPTRVTCTGCRWTGRRAHRTAERRPCPKCAGRVVRGRWNLPTTPATATPSSPRPMLRAVAANGRRAYRS